MTILQKAHDVKRISQIVHILFKNGFGYFIKETGLNFHLPLTKKMQKSKFLPEANPEKRLKLVLEEIGGSYIKLGQLLSIRPDLINKKACDELSKLQDDVAPISFAAVKTVVEKELKKPLKEMFRKFEEKPIAAASIGQVHKAILKNGKKVAVKVQRPFIKEIIDTDIDIMEYFAHRMEHSKRFQHYRPSLIVEEFRRYTEEEVNYIREGRNADQFYNNFKKSKNIKIPKVYWSHTTEKVLTLEFIEGIKLKEYINSKNKINKKAIIEKGLESEMKQIFEDGFFHADLHPGNIIITQDNKLAFLDFGIVGVITSKIKSSSIKLLAAILDKDTESISNVLLSIGTREKEVEREEFSREIDFIINGWYGARLGQERVTSMLHKLFNLCGKYYIRLPIDLVLLGKALVTVEATSKLIDENYDIIKNSQPYLKRLIKKSSKQELKELIKSYSNFAQSAKDMPKELTELIEVIKHPKLKVELNDENIRYLGHELDKSSDRLTYGIVISAFVVAGAMIMQFSPPPFIMGISIFPLIFFTIAAILSIILIRSIFKEPR